MVGEAVTVVVGPVVVDPNYTLREEYTLNTLLSYVVLICIEYVGYFFCIVGEG